MTIETSYKCLCHTIEHEDLIIDIVEHEYLI